MNIGLMQMAFKELKTMIHIYMVSWINMEM